MSHLLDDPPHMLEHADTAAILRLLREHQTLLDSAGIGVALIRQRVLERCNQRYADIFGYPTPQEMAGISSVSFHPSRSNFRALGRSAYPFLSQGQTFKTERLMQRKNGRLFWGSLTGRLINPQDPSEGSIWTIDDIDEHKQAQSLLGNVMREKQLLFDHAAIGIAFYRDGKITRCNPHLEQMLGYRIGELQDVAPHCLISDTQAWSLLQQKNQGFLLHGLRFDAEVSLRRKDGTHIDCEIRCKLLDAADPTQGSVWILEDITTRKQAQQQLTQIQSRLEQQVRERTQELSTTVANLHREVQDRLQDQERIYWLAHYDPLTGLPNRTLLAQRSAAAIQTASDNSSPLAVIFLDLDHFKHVNDSLGHKVGDALLVEIGKRLRSAVRERDTVARLGGDEFVLLLPGANAQGAARVAEKLQQAALQPYQIERHELTIAPSMGIALHPRDGTDFDTLTQAADVAMYHAKLDGRNTFRFYTPEMQAKSLRALQLENALRRALERNQFQLHYQPQVCLHTGHIHSAEALLRWQHPELGFISPAEFIPVAEDSGQILQIGEWVLRTAVEQLKHWRGKGLGKIKVAVNLSAIQFHQPQLPEMVNRILTESGISPDLLELELTEGVAVQDPRTATVTMDRLNAHGIRLSMDDFGTGYSSLSQLKRFQIYKLKIDQSFIRDIDHDSNDRAIVSAIIRMAQALGMRTTAEGVETQEQLDFLRTQGCDEAQGYHFSRPLAASDFASFLQQYRLQH
ncbi:MAG: EAL domain-containing protein [Acidovorax sp.]|nr:EAL domain-containing protein [Acidovorax sp.]